jgi:hypothetical protein
LINRIVFDFAVLADSFKYFSSGNIGKDMADVYDSSLVIPVFFGLIVSKIEKVVTEHAPIEALLGLLHVGGVFVGDDGGPEHCFLVLVLDFDGFSQLAELLKLFLGMMGV